MWGVQRSNPEPTPAVDARREHFRGKRRHALTGA
jgi:hypothetical protein